MVSKDILDAFGVTAAASDIQKFGSGHINNTFLLSGGDGKKYILQRINTYVFKEPEVIARNQRMAASYLADQHPDYLFITPIPTVTGEDLFHYKEEY